MIRIAHLYPSELNLYGESGNIKALKYGLEQKNQKCEIINIEPNDKIDFKTYDLVYIGSGRQIFKEKIKKRLEPYKEDILKYLKQDKIFLVTGNAINIFEFLDLYKVETYTKRKVSDVKATCSLCPGLIKGFQNTECLINTTKSPIFNIEEGYGNSDTLIEGYKYHELYVTTIIGPILARNENLNNYFLDLLLQK